MSLLPVSSARVCRPRRNLFPINFSIQLFPAAFSEFFENSVWEQSVWTVPRVHNLNLNNLLVPISFVTECVSRKPWKVAAS